jgi:hypothetical protein
VGLDVVVGVATGLAGGGDAVVVVGGDVVGVPDEKSRTFRRSALLVLMVVRNVHRT